MARSSLTATFRAADGRRVHSSTEDTAMTKKVQLNMADNVACRARQQGLTLAITATI